MNISNIVAREILDSRGNPTIEADVVLENGMIGSAKVPSGASTGVHEALELRDGDTQRFDGKGVLKAVQNVNTTIREALIGQSVLDLRALDRAMIALDGTDNKANLGANAILAVSLAAARAAALHADKPLYVFLAEYFGFDTAAYKMPVPMCNVLNGGAHADSGLDVQEFMICPIGATDFRSAVQMGAEVFQVLKKLLAQDGHSTSVGDEGGFAPRLESSIAVFDYLMRAVEQAGYVPGKDIAFAVDVAASEFYKADSHMYSFEGQERTREEMFDIYDQWIEAYPLISLEDPLDQDDWAGWSAALTRFKGRTQVVADDFLVTNVLRLRQAIAERCADSLLIKVNQIGSLTETMEAIKLSYDASWAVFPSHRSGETSDTFISDLAVACGSQQLKSGALSRSERVEKYNRLMRIEADLKEQGVDVSYGWVSID